MTVFPRSLKKLVLKPDPSVTTTAEAEVLPVPTGLVTDEGLPFERVDQQTIVNLATGDFDARRRELHVAARTYSHVGEWGDRWLYRCDD